MTPERTAIIARLEAATGPDRELSRDIAFALGWRVCWGKWYSPATAAEARKSKKALPAYPASLEPPDFTGSLDAALTLVPKGWGYQITHSKSGVDVTMWVMGEEEEEQGSFFSAVSVIVAIALCNAALIARWSDERNAT